MTRHVVIGTAGHIDHGKSALVRALTGTDPDRLKEEKSRGITIDLGFAHWREGDTELAFVDVPGHERFVKNMLAGASGIDGVLLVVAADESVMPQTREHFDICRLLGVRYGVVALTKADLVDHETVELVELETNELLAGSPLEQAAIVPVSATTGAGLDDIRRALLAMAEAVPTRAASGLARFPIDRVFTVKGFGTVVTGTLVSGVVSVDDTLSVLPARRDVKVRGVQVHGSRQTTAVAGQRVAINLSGVELVDINRGDTALTPGGFEATSWLDVVLQLLPSARRLRHGARIRFHQGTAEVLGRVALGRRLDDPDALTDAPDALPPGGESFARLRLEQATVLTRGDRFILRAYSPPLTIAGGRVLDPFPPRGGIRTEAGRHRLQRLLEGVSASTGDAQDQAVRVLIGERGLTGLGRGDVVSRAGVSPDAGDKIVSRLTQAGVIRCVGDRLVDVGALHESGDRLISLLSEFHRTHADSEGLPREEARERLFHHSGAGVFEAVLEHLTSIGQLRVGEHVALTSHQVTVSPEDTRLAETVVGLLREARLRPPAMVNLREELGVDEARLDRVFRRLVRQHRVIRMGALVFDVGAVETLKSDLGALKTASEGATIDVGTFKERYGVSRKFAIPLLEYLDRERVTRRLGQKRILL